MQRVQPFDNAILQNNGFPATRSNNYVFGIKGNQQYPVMHGNNFVPQTNRIVPLKLNQNVKINPTIYSSIVWGNNLDFIKCIYVFKSWSLFEFYNKSFYLIFKAS